MSYRQAARENCVAFRNIKDMSLRIENLKRSILFFGLKLLIVVNEA